MVINGQHFLYQLLQLFTYISILRELQCLRPNIEIEILGTISCPGSIPKQQFIDHDACWPYITLATELLSHEYLGTHVDRSAYMGQQLGIIHSLDDLSVAEVSDLHFAFM